MRNLHLMCWLYLFVTIIRSHVCVMVHAHMYVCCVHTVWNVMVCWVSAPECDWCLFSTFSTLLLYCSTVTGVCLIHLVFLMVILSVFITCTQQDCPQWSSPFSSMITPCIHGLPHSLLTPSVDPMETNVESLWVPLFLMYALLPWFSHFTVLIIFINVYWFPPNLWRHCPNGAIEQQCCLTGCASTNQCWSYLR